MPKTFFIKLIKQLKPIEFSIITYLLITLVPAILIVSSIHAGFLTLGIHILFIFLISGIALSVKNNCQTREWYIPIRILYPLVLLGFLYKETDFLNNLLFKQNLDPFFAFIEEFIFGLQPSLEFAKLIPSNLFAECMYFGYFAYYLMLIGLPIVWYQKKGAASTEKMIFIIIQSFLIFYIFFDLIPVAGPQFYFNNADPLPQGYLFGFLIRTIQQTGEAPTAAFPSSHVALCLIMVYLVFLESKKTVLFLLPVAIMLIFSTIYIRAHYVIDILGAFIVAPIVYHLSLNLFSKIKSIS